MSVETNTIGELFQLDPGVARAALVLLDVRIAGRLPRREMFRRAPEMTDEQALTLAIRLCELTSTDIDPEHVRQGALLLKSRMSRDEIERAAL